MREDSVVEIRPLNIAEVKRIVPTIHRDARGFLSESYNRRILESAGITADFVQENHSLSADAGTLRGLHFQVPPHAQGKLVRVTRGSVYDVAVDIRVGSPTFGQHVGAVLSAENWTQMWIPAGFAHGFCTLEPDTEVIYKVTAYYAPDCDRGLKWNDVALGIKWPVDHDRAILSDKDRRQPALNEMVAAFFFET
ncbi:dTDP-4-dehydrorhamnose 3,5-epimerase [Bradyrhizobium sp.]|uniref:dTDP-4-dehydrorhamnose 3,5-epimerase n=1 Tax=Bradyrhizobium sp. TaxID=376 RepID=UPI0027351F3E|nr:dTDP-4-dehydrorhamnose 3,5-epimerase [Bradyrhizobium sp.]MDP3075381.1 dTDP-4-dehydrorhamnose 3,5-epimerase [Bradyrhizobium sp.]